MTVMKRITIYLIFFLILIGCKYSFGEVSYKATPVTGIGQEENVMRRDSSDIIKVGDLYYIWYTCVKSDKKLTGYNATIWYSTSKDGINWDEKGEVIARGPKDNFDDQSVFTPNILIAGGKYWLFYTAVKGAFNKRKTKTSIGLASSISPDGPWQKISDQPILKVSDNPEDFDSFRIDDASLIVREGKYFMYYKGRQIGKKSTETKMGVAIAKKPEGPYIKHDKNPVILGGHEVTAWPYKKGVICLINKTAPKDIRNSLQYAEDGINFKKMTDLKKAPQGAGTYRIDNFVEKDNNEMITWGICIITAGPAYLERFDYQWEEK